MVHVAKSWYIMLFPLYRYIESFGSLSCYCEECTHTIGTRIQHLTERSQEINRVFGNGVLLRTSGPAEQYINARDW